MKKQIKYVDNRKVPHAIIIGSEERESGKLNLKNMNSGDQESLTLDQIIKKLS